MLVATALRKGRLGKLSELHTHCTAIKPALVQGLCRCQRCIHSHKPHEYEPNTTGFIVTATALCVGEQTHTWTQRTM